MFPDDLMTNPTALMVCMVKIGMSGLLGEAAGLCRHTYGVLLNNTYGQSKGPNIQQ